MNRAFSLIKEMKAVFGCRRPGAFITKKDQNRILKSIIDDLVKNKIAPKSFNLMTKEHFVALVKYWQSNNLSMRSIGNKLGVFRVFVKFGKFNIVVPSNKELGVASTYKTKNKQVVDDSIIECLGHPITKTILAFQLYFGLTKTESVRLNLTLSLHGDRLYIPKKISFNGKDRWIPVENEKQRKIIQDRLLLLASNESLLDLVDERILMDLCRADFLIKGLDPNAKYRKFYAKWRQKELLKRHNQVVANKKLLAELGTKSLYYLLS